MKIAAPVLKAEQIEVLKENGAGEIYVGYMGPEWERAYGNYDSVSRRQGAGNVTDRGGFTALLDEARRLQIPCSLTLNSRYIESQLTLLGHTLDLFASHGGSGVMVSDITLMSHMNTHYPDLRIYLSLTAVACSYAAIEFYVRHFNIKRVVLPRFTPIADMNSLTSRFPELEFEVLVFYNQCPYIDGFCRYYHGVQTENSSYDTLYRGHGCDLVIEEGCANGSDGLYSCGACMIETLENAGIDIFKIGGRGFPEEKVRQAVRMVNSMKTGDDPEKVYEKIFGGPCGRKCYVFN